MMSLNSSKHDTLLLDSGERCSPGHIWLIALFNCSLRDERIRITLKFIQSASYSEWCLGKKTRNDTSKIEYQSD
jgi:hypothetical protein